MILGAIFAIAVLAQGKPLSLQQALQEARERHPALAALRTDIDAAQARKNMELSAYHPQVSLNGFGVTGNGNMIFSSTGMPTSYAMLPNSNVAVANAMLMWRLFTFGKDRFLSRSHDEIIAATRLSLDAGRADVELRVRLGFSDALLKQDVVKAREDALASAKELSRVTRAKVEAGSFPEAFLLRAEAEVARMEKELAMASADRDSSLAMLHEAVGESATVPIVVGAWDEKISLPGSLDVAVSQAIQNRPELKGLAHERQSSLYGIDAVRASSRPEISLVAMGESMRPSGAPFDDSAKIGLVLSFPLVDGGERKAAIAQSAAMAKRSEAELAELRLKIEAEVSAAWSVWQSVPSVMKASQAEFVASAEAHRIAMIRYEEGKAILAEVLDTRAQLTLAQVGLAEAEAYSRSAESRLVRAWLGQ
jgi:outer membrane protein TolC